MSPLLAAAARAPEVTAETLLEGCETLIVVAPHPDDETLGCGCLLHEAARLGRRCRVVCVTDGSASHRNSAAWPAARLAAARRAEFSAAVACLAPAAETVWLGFGDCRLPAEEGAEAAAARLSPHLEEGALVVAPWRGDPHVDHVRTAALLTRALARHRRVDRLAYPIWGRFSQEAAPPGLQRLSAPPEALAAKRRALACHATQMTRLIDDDPEGFVMTDADQAHFLDHPEIFHAAP